MERTINDLEENPDGENTMKVWKDHTIDDAIVVNKKPGKTNSFWRKLHPDVVHDFKGLTTESIKAIMKEIVNIA